MDELEMLQSDDLAQATSAGAAEIYWSLVRMQEILSVI